MDKEQTATERLKTESDMSPVVYGLPLAVTTSGGKGSFVCMAISGTVWDTV